LVRGYVKLKSWSRNESLESAERGRSAIDVNAIDVNAIDVNAIDVNAIDVNAIEIRRALDGKMAG